MSNESGQKREKRSTWTFSRRVIVAIVVFFALELIWIWIWAVPAKEQKRPDPIWPAKVVEFLPVALQSITLSLIRGGLATFQIIWPWLTWFNRFLIPFLLYLAVAHRWTIELLHQNLHAEEQNPPLPTKIGAVFVQKSRFRRGVHAVFGWLIGAFFAFFGWLIGAFFNWKWYQGLLSTQTLRAVLRVLTQPGPSWCPPLPKPGDKRLEARLALMANQSLSGLSWGQASVTLLSRFLAKAALYTTTYLRPLVDPRRSYERAQIFIEVTLLMRGRAQSQVGRGDYVLQQYLMRVPQHERGSSQVKPIECQTLFDVFEDGVNDVKESVETYLQKQWELPKPRNLFAAARERESRFLCPVLIRSGFLAPTYLVSGLLSEFNDDWKKIVWGYRRDIERLRSPDDDVLASFPDLRKLQIFIWDCWIQWGPSVPICGSDNWTTRGIGVQYGYGDENNSLPLIVDRTLLSQLIRRGKGRSEVANSMETAKSTETLTGQGSGHLASDASAYVTWNGWSELWRTWLDEHEATGRTSSPENESFVIPAQVIADLMWVPPDSKQFCSAQSVKKDPWLALNARSIAAKWDSPRLYSAYVWVVVAICMTRQDDRTPTGDGSTAAPSSKRDFDPIYPLDGDQPWRSLIPFFQHGNIAEPSVYQDIREELASKVIDTLMRFLEENSSLENNIHFAYVCAFDDNGDGADNSASLARCIPANDSSAGVAAELGSRRNGKTIREMLESDLSRYVARGQNCSGSLLQNLKKRVHLSRDTIPELSACQLPGLVQKFLTDTGKIPDTTAMPIVNLREVSPGQTFVPALKRLYEDIYVKAFPFPDEQESCDQYVERVLLRRGSSPETHLLVAGTNLDRDDDIEFGGFVIVEWYRNSQCGLMTYLAVRPEARQQGLATRLVQEALAKLVERNGGVAPRAVFAETGNPESPERLASHADTMDPGDRLRVLGQLGANLVPIEHYVQPKLGVGKKPSRGLLLLAFDPVPSEDDLEAADVRITVDVCERFLDEYFQAQDAASSEELAALSLMKSELRNATESTVSKSMFESFGLKVAEILVAPEKQAAN